MKKFLAMFLVAISIVCAAVPTFAGVSEANWGYGTDNKTQTTYGIISSDNIYEFTQTKGVAYYKAPNGSKRTVSTYAKYKIVVKEQKTKKTVGTYTCSSKSLKMTLRKNTAYTFTVTCQGVPDTMRVWFFGWVYNGTWATKTKWGVY